MTPANMSETRGEYADTTADKGDDMAHGTTTTATTTTHNTSLQHNVATDPDPALNVSHEHHHTHLHHSSKAVHDEGVSYSKGTTDEPSVIPKADAMDNALHRRHVDTEYEKGGLKFQDAEAGEVSAAGSEEEDPRSHRLSHVYRRFKPFVHLLIFIVFTG